MVVVAYRLEVHQQRGTPLNAQGRSGQQRTLHAVSLSLAQDPPGRPRCICVLVGKRVNKLLNLSRCFERAQRAQFFQREAECFMFLLWTPISRQSRAPQRQCTLSLILEVAASIQLRLNLGLPSSRSGCRRITLLTQSAGGRKNSLTRPRTARTHAAPTARAASSPSECVSDSIDRRLHGACPPGETPSKANRTGSRCLRG